MLNMTVEQVAKKSLLYSVALSQPFAIHADIYPELQNKLLLQQESLQYGEHGEMVRFLQQKLTKVSYYEDRIDGEYGVFTEYALKKFQKDHHLTITGEADPQTIYALIQAEKEKMIENIKGLSEPITIGMESEDVKIIQESLQYLGYYQGDIDGIYGPLTNQAVKLAEEKHNVELIDEQDLLPLYESEEEQNDADVPLSDEQEETIQVDHSQDESSSDQQHGRETSVPKEEITTSESKTKSKQSKENEESKRTKVFSEGAGHPDLIGEARSHIGTPYVWGGESPGGFDCSGFIQYVFQTQNITIPRTVRDIWNFSQPVSSPSVGDLVFFETYQPGPSHLGIYLGNNQFIHAGSSNGVQISDLNESYWEERYLGAKQVNK
ncbi:MAG TPA: NlpC/P60 family protein [Bacillota bacterium]